MSEVCETHVTTVSSSTLSRKQSKVQYRLLELNIKKIYLWKYYGKWCHSVYINAAKHKINNKETWENISIYLVIHLCLLTRLSVRRGFNRNTAINLYKYDTPSVSTQKIGKFWKWANLWRIILTFFVNRRRN
jgi:hypothetical protein